MQQAQEFWDDIFQNRSHDAEHLVDFPDPANPVFRRALQHFGDVRGKTLVDVGCGSGASALFFASLGARVIAIDLSSKAIDNLRRYCADHGITNIDPRVMSAQDIGSLKGADFVFGSMILHHIEPFADFARALRHAVAPGGKAFFWENNGASDAMMWFRANVIGKFWIPKYGDTDESPLAPHEVDQLRKHFRVTAEFPELIYFRMASTYLLRGRLHRQAARIDDYLYRFPAIRKYSYRQYLSLQ